MKHLLVVDDEPKDVMTALGVARSLGIEDVQIKNSLREARAHLQDGLSGKIPLPDAIVLDLDFGPDSGFELLRFRHSTPELASVPIVVWSVVEEQRRICELFSINSFVSKWQGMDALRDALNDLLPEQRSH